MAPGAVPSANQPEPVHYRAQLAAYNPALIGNSLASDLSGVAFVPDGMAQLNAVTVGNAHQRGGGQEAPGRVELGVPAAEQAGACRQFAEQVYVVVAEPGAKSALPDVFDGVEDADGDDFADR